MSDTQKNIGDKILGAGAAFVAEIERPGFSPDRIWFLRGAANADIAQDGRGSVLYWAREELLALDEIETLTRERDEARAAAFEEGKNKAADVLRQYREIPNVGTLGGGKADAITVKAMNAMDAGLAEVESLIRSLPSEPSRAKSAIFHSCIAVTPKDGDDWIVIFGDGHFYDCQYQDIPTNKFRQYDFWCYRDELFEQGQMAFIASEPSRTGETA